ncbi:Poly [ADP-ribose] polymerase 2 [Rhizophlyctis rosea]|uniref:Poly [ADP-ribose] polymerase n=1 Tax=Rhizophlyctis rosea TaxID=64517 RepID=A0AAD5SJ94_9FUNG|nr:Poly [ADP-ribose] polymerase 2 [Rhizophlyctis rosea]
MPPKRKAASKSDLEPIFEDFFVTLTPAALKDSAGREAQKHVKERGGFIVATLTHLVALPEDLSSDKPPAKLKAANEANASYGRTVYTVTPDFFIDSAKEDKVLEPKGYDPKTAKGSSSKDADANDDVAMPDANNHEDAEEEEEEKPKTRTSGRQKKKVEVQDDDKEEEKPKPRASTRRKAKVETKEEDEEEKEEEEEIKPRPSKRQKTKASKDEEEEEAKPAAPVAPKMVKAIKKGRAPVDHICGIASKVHVYEEGDNVYGEVLVVYIHTEISQNNNKFYVIQLLEEDGKQSYYVWTRWGRVGVNGQNKLEPCGSSLDKAKMLFEKKFQDKTKNHWDSRADFEKVPGKYFLIERDFGGDDEEEEEKEEPAADGKGKEPVKIPDSKLAKPVQELVKLIFNLDMMTKQMVEIGYDANKMPLGKLSKANMKKGYDVLKSIADLINGVSSNKNRELQDLSSKFYTIIPHEFGRNVPPTINSPQMVKQKLEMIEALGDIDIATTLMKDVKQNLDKNPIDVEYGSLKCELEPVDRKAEKFDLVERYMQNTHAKTHAHYKLELLDLFEVDRNGEDDRFSGGQGAKLHNHQLLWHGSRLTNYVGILSQGLRIAPPEAPVTGYMFGKGIYFADMVSKSANYCYTNRNENTGILLLCEVALGDTNKLKQADYNAGDTASRAGKHSTWGLGRTGPDPNQTVKLEDGVEVPCGTPVDTKETGLSLMYNEFIVYSLDQVKIRLVGGFE